MVRTAEAAAPRQVTLIDRRDVRPGRNPLRLGEFVDSRYNE